MTKLKLLILTLLCPVLFYGQSVTLFIETSGFSDENQVASNDMAWGIIVDTTGTGFSSLSTSQLQPFTFPPLNSIADLGDGLVFVRAGENTKNGPPPTFSAGFMDTIAGIPINDNPNANNIKTGDLYGLIWFSSSSAQAGDAYGFIDLGLSLPPQGGNPNISSSVNPSSANLTVVPEPSTYAAIVGLLALALVGFRRFRS